MRSIVVPALTLILGIGLGVGLALIGMMPSERPRLLDEEEPSATERPGAASSSPAATHSAPRTTTPRRPPPRPVAREELEQARDLIAAVDAGELEVLRGSGQISGRVMDASRLPLEGVTVTATVIPESELRDMGRGRWLPRSDDSDLSLEERVVKTVRDHRFTQENQRVTTTDEQGFYVVTELGEASYRLRAELDGYDINPERRSWRGVKPGATFDFVAARTLQLRITVLMPDGTEADEAEVRIRGRGDTDQERWTPDDRQIDIEPGKYELRARYESGDEVYVSEDVSVEFALGDAAPSATLQLRESGGVKGRVLMPPGSADRGVYVHLLRMKGAALPELETLVDDGRSDWAERSTTFEFKFTDLDPGTYCVGVTRFRDRMLMDMVSVVVGDTMVEVDLRASPTDRSEYVVLWVFGPDGKLLRDVDVGSGLRNARGAFDYGEGIRQEDGSWWVFHPKALADNPVGAGGVTAYIASSSDEFGRIETLYDPRSSSQVELRFPAPASLQVTVLGYSAHPRADELSLSVEQRTADGRGRRIRGRGSLDDQGTQTFEPLSPGEYEVRLTMRRGGGGRGRGVVLERTLVTVGEGVSRATMRIPSMFTLTVNAPELPAESQIRVRCLDPEQQDRGASKPLDESGHAIFDGLLAGEYRISGGAGSMTIDLGGSTTVAFEPRAEDALVIQVEDAGGYLGQVGLRTGDRIIGVGEVEMHNHHQIQGALIEAAGTGDLVTLRILRGGTEVQIEVDGARLQRRDGLGGRLEPGHR